MVLDAIATVILSGLMLVPIVNVFVGAVCGAGLFGPSGIVAGVLLSIGITWLEVGLADAFGWRDLHSVSVAAPDTVAAVESPTMRHTIRTGPPSRRRQPRLSHEVQRGVQRMTQTRTLQHGAVR
jgi:hypothetical protein